ncbi:MAG: M3 family metallopeptidase [Candidatus Aminicenantes bacterium]|nr:M3 family metallopeptidase [Candidatus Aminicenantes bacterium]
MKYILSILVLFVLACAVGGPSPAAAADRQAPPPPSPPPQADNPFFKPYGTPFNVPPFHLIKNEHFLPAIEEAMKREAAEIEAIIADPEPPTFENILAALDHSGIFMDEVLSVFGALRSAHTNRELQALAQKTAPMLAAHRDNIALNEKLFLRVKAVYDGRDSLNLDREQRYLLEKTYRGFVRSGALLDEKQKTRLRELNQELSVMTLKFGDNVLAETNAFKLVIDDPADLAGLPESVRAMAAATAKRAGLDGRWVFTIQVPSLIPFLQFSEKRELREKLHRAYIMKGDNGNEHDNKDIVKRIIALRQERAELIGYDTHAHFVLENNMAKTPDTVNAFLARLWTPTLAKLKAEAAELQALIDREGGGFKLAHWDWWYYTEKLRQEKYALDDSALRPYFMLDNVRHGVFTLCNKLYGLKFFELKDMPVYHPEVQVFEVQEADGSHVGVLYMDFHPRDSKRGGAWSGAFRGSYYEEGKRVPPVATIVCNFTRPTADAPSLLSADEVSTFFHEFGHALDTLFSQSRYRSRFRGRDSVELPSQLMEHWVFEPALLAEYAKHYKTGEVIPAELVEKIEKSRLFNQGFITGEYLAAAILDMAWHTLLETEGLDVNAFEKRVLDGIGLIPEVVSRYRSTYFNHIFSGGYAAGYYAYIWSEVLDSDAYEAFKEKGDIFDRETALSFRKNVLEPFGTEDIEVLYRRFRGADPKIEPLLRNRGLEVEN